MGFRTGDQSMSVRTVSMYLAVPERTIRHWARTGVLAGRRTRKRWVFDSGVVTVSARRLGRKHGGSWEVLMLPECLRNIVDVALATALALHAAKFVVVEIADLWILIRRPLSPVLVTARFTAFM